MNESEHIVDLIAAIEKDCVENSAFFPVDRYCLEKYLPQILEFDNVEFIVSVFNLNNQLFSVQLMVCLPELWEELGYAGILDIIKRMHSEIALFSLIEFTYKFVEINIIEIVLSPNYLNSGFQSAVKLYLRSQIMNLYKTEYDYMCFANGIWGVRLEQWKYIKQRILLEKEIVPSFENEMELRLYVNTMK